VLKPGDIHTLAGHVLRLALEAGRAILEVYRSDDFQIERKPDWSPLTLADRRAHDIIDAGLGSLTPEVPVLSEEGREVPFSERTGWRELWLVDPLDGTKEFIKGNGEFTVNIGLIQDAEPVLGVVVAPARGVAYVGICADDPTHEDDGDGRPAPEHGDSTGTRIHVRGERHAGSGVETLGLSGPGAYRFQIARPGGAESGAELLEAPERIRGAGPDGRALAVIASRTHMGIRTRAFVRSAGRNHDIRLVHVGSSLKLCMIAEGHAHIYPRFWPTMEWDTAAGHALVRAAGGEVWNAPRDGRGPQPDWFAGQPSDPASRLQGDHGDAAGEPRGPVPVEPVRYNRENLKNTAFVARGW